MADARGLLQSLVGRRLQTVTGRENRVLGVDADTVRVWTSRSPSGQPIPIAWVQDALDRLDRDGEIETRSGPSGIAVPSSARFWLSFRRAQVLRTVSPPKIRLTQARVGPPAVRQRRSSSLAA